MNDLAGLFGSIRSWGGVVLASESLTEWTECADRAGARRVRSGGAAGGAAVDLDPGDGAPARRVAGDVGPRAAVVGALEQPAAGVDVDGGVDRGDVGRLLGGVHDGCVHR